MSPREKKNTEAEAQADAPTSDVEITTNATATPDLSTGQGVGDVEAEDVPNALEASNLPPEVRAELVKNHPVTPGAQPAIQTAKEQPMPVVTGTREGGGANDRPIVYFTTDAHPELVVWHPNGENWVQFHNGRYGTANAEWQAVLEATPEVSRADDDESVDQGGKLQIDKDGRVHSLAGADVEPVRVAEVAGNNA